jgi:hypothetical protein
MKNITSILNLTNNKISAVIFLMLVLGLQLKYSASASANQFWDRVTILLIFFLIFRDKKYNLSILFVVWMLISFFLGSIKQGLFDAIIFYFGFILASKYKLTILPSIQVLMALNILIMLLQISGISSSLYIFQNYNGEASILNSIFTFDAGTKLPLMQLRPSGIFHSTVYLSLFNFFLTAYFFTKKTMSRSQLVMLSLLFVLSGSTACLMLVFLAIFFKNSNFSREFCFLYLFFISLYRILLPKMFFEYNYSTTDFISSFNSRFSISYFSQYPTNNLHLLVFIAFIALVLYFAIKAQKKYFELLHLIFLGALALGPLVIHDLSMVSFYWFHIGFLYGIFFNDFSKIINLYSPKNG